MSSRHESTPPVPIGPLHRRTWRTLWRRCTCGLPEPCVDRLTTTPLPPVPPAEQPGFSPIRSFPSTPQTPPSRNLTLRPGRPTVAGTLGDLTLRHDVQRSSCPPSQLPFRESEQHLGGAPGAIALHRRAQHNGGALGDITLRGGAGSSAGTAGDPNFHRGAHHSGDAPDSADGYGFSMSAATQILPVLSEPLPSPGRAGNLTPAQSLRADHALCTRSLQPSIRAAPPGRAGRPTGFAGLDAASSDPYQPHHRLISPHDGGHPDPSRPDGSRTDRSRPDGSRTGGSRS